MNDTAVTGPRSPRWAFMCKTTIPCHDGLVYLVRRRILQTPWFGVMVHDINEPDADRDPHNHPWVFWSLVLRGGYTEKVYVKTRRVGRRGLVFRGQRTHERWSLHKMPLEHAHRITDVQPGLKTLIFTGPRVKSWGFFTSRGYVPWQSYVAERDSR